jgi:hypothetical protein
LRRPDHLTRQPRASVNARNRRALGRGHHIEISKARPDDRLIAWPEQLAIDDISDQRAGEAPGNCIGWPEQRASGAACDGKNKRCHQSETPGKQNA